MSPIEETIPQSKTLWNWAVRVAASIAFGSSNCPTIDAGPCSFDWPQLPCEHVQKSRQANGNVWSNDGEVDVGVICSDRFGDNDFAE